MTTIVLASFLLPRVRCEQPKADAKRMREPTLRGTGGGNPLECQLAIAAVPECAALIDLLYAGASCFEGGQDGGHATPPNCPTPEPHRSLPSYSSLISHGMMHVSARTPSRASALCVALMSLCAGMSSCSDEGHTPRTSQDDEGGLELGNGADEPGDMHPPVIDLTELRGLGYTDFSEEEDWSTIDGLVIHDPQRASKGYTFYVDIPTARAFLIDMEGVERASWSIPGTRRWVRGIIMEDGDLLAVGVSDSESRVSMSKHDAEAPKGGFLLRMSWSGEILWNKQVGAHHDVQLTPLGQILVLGESRRFTELHPECGIIDNSVMLFSADGQLLDEISAFDLLRSAPKIHDFKEPRMEEKCSLGYPTDCVHLNCCRWIDRPDLVGRHPIYEPGNVIITSRMQHSAAIFNFESGQMIWAWGRGTMLFPHEAQVLDNGHILILDNGAPNKRPFSRVIELDPVGNEIVWSYSATPPESFFTAGRGTVQRLPNDNILISSSGQGQIFEVARNGDVVWRYHNPHFSQDKNLKTRGALRAQRYAPDFIDPLLADAARRKSGQSQNGK